jgi:hypothetical protein
MYVNCVILDGLYTRVQDEELIVEHWIMYAHKSYKATAMIHVLIFGP